VGFAVRKVGPMVLDPFRHDEGAGSRGTGQSHAESLVEAPLGPRSYRLIREGRHEMSEEECQVWEAAQILRWKLIRDESERLAPIREDPPCFLSMVPRGTRVAVSHLEIHEFHVQFDVVALASDGSSRPGHGGLFDDLDAFCVGGDGQGSHGGLVVGKPVRELVGRGLARGLDGHGPLIVRGCVCRATGGPGNDGNGCGEQGRDAHFGMKVHTYSCSRREGTVKTCCARPCSALREWFGVWRFDSAAMDSIQM